MARILVVEDNELNRDLIVRRLMRRGYEVLEASDGHQGLEKAQVERLDLIVTDLGLPGMDGYELARRLKADENTKMIPLLALTAYARNEDRERAMAAGCNEFETKPIVLESLLRKICALLKQPSAGASEVSGEGI